MIKKTLAITMALCMIIVTFTSCKKDNEKSSSTAPKTTVTTSPKITVVPTSAGDKTASSTPAVTSSSAVTDYSIDLDFQIKTGVAGIVFGYKGEMEFLMWQIGARDVESKVYFTPHICETTFTVIEEKDISDIVKWEDAYKIHHLKITVDSKNEVKTYIDTILIYTYTDEMAAYGNFGLRQWTTEEAYVDNIVIKNTLNSQILSQYDFNTGTNPFPEGTIESDIMAGSPALYITNSTGLGETTILP